MRRVSPQRLIHHRDNWYLDAWNPAQSALRRDALDRIRKPELSPEPAIEIPTDQLGAHQEAGYGIFAGPIKATASGPRHSLGRSSAQNAAHSQRADSPTSPPTPLAGQPTSTGTPPNARNCYPTAPEELTLPDANPRELLMDVQRYGADAEIIAPAELREQMQAMLAAALARYSV